MFRTARGGVMEKGIPVQRVELKRKKFGCTVLAPFAMKPGVEFTNNDALQEMQWRMTQYIASQELEQFAVSWPQTWRDAVKEVLATWLRGRKWPRTWPRWL